MQFLKIVKPSYQKNRVPIFKLFRINRSYKMSKTMTFENALSLKIPTTSFMCQLKDNKYALQFLKFEIKDHETGEMYYEHEQDPLANSEMLINDDDYDPEVLKVFDSMRMINYTFSKAFLTSKEISSLLVFKVGDSPVSNLTIVDHFFFKNKLIKSFQFNFPFCAPNATNEWEYVYQFPKIEEAMKEEMLACPAETKSETFFFVDQKIVLHNKADYKFVSSN